MSLTAVQESEMVERVARAIEAEMTDTDPNDPDCYRRLSRASIAAMREPTEGMMRAYWQIGPDDPLPTSADLDADWRAMIDAALCP